MDNGTLMLIQISSSYWHPLLARVGGARLVHQAGLFCVAMWVGIAGGQSEKSPMNSRRRRPSKA
jgi:hypothetical protein